MTATTDIRSTSGAEAVRWDLEPLVEGDGPAGVDRHLEDAARLAHQLTDDAKGTLAGLDAGQLADVMHRYAAVHEHIERAGSYAHLLHSVDTRSPEVGALVARVDEGSASVAATLVWLELEWLKVPEDVAQRLLADERLAFCAHHLRIQRRKRDHVLDEDVERVLAEKSPTGPAAWVRLFTQLTSSIEVELDGETLTLDEGLSRLRLPERDQRRQAAEALTSALEPDLRTRAYAFNTLLADKAIDDRLRGHASWISAWNLDQEASDEAVAALVKAVVARYELPQRWYSLKAVLLGVDRLADYDRLAPVGVDEAEIPWEEARGTVIDAYGSFSPTLQGIVERFLTDRWIDAPPGPGKRGGAFCAYTVPDHHPYVFLNYTGQADDVMTIAHELGHACHGYLAREQGIFHQDTPLTVAETASVFGETVTFERLLAATDDPHRRLALLADNVEGHIATIFRQTAMNRFEDAVHTHRRETGELSLDDFAQHWTRTQAEMLGDSVEITDGYRTWWSYIPHFIGTPGYVYAYAFGQLLALSVYARYVVDGESMVPAYEEMLAAGGSRSPEELAAIVGCDLTDPGFWDAGLDIVAGALARTEAAAAEVQI
jgi:oligoendopeptidase F